MTSIVVPARVRPELPPFNGDSLMEALVAKATVERELDQFGRNPTGFPVGVEELLLDESNKDVLKFPDSSEVPSGILAKVGTQAVNQFFADHNRQYLMRQSKDVRELPLLMIAGNYHTKIRVSSVAEGGLRRALFWNYTHSAVKRRLQRHMESNDSIGGRIEYPGYSDVDFGLATPGMSLRDLAGIATAYIKAVDPRSLEPLVSIEVLL